jgi:XrtJ-associated TM-motif-TM protein
MYQITVFFLATQGGTTETVFPRSQMDFCNHPFTASITSPWRPSMKKSALAFLGFALLLAVALPMHAQDGCTNSPENPTAILAVVGSAGAFLASARARIKARRRSK